MRGITLTTALALALTASHAGAAGFALGELDVRGLGSSFAGSAALAADATTVWYNPAGMVFREGTRTSSGVIGIRPRFDLGASATQSTATGDVPISGGGSQGGVNALISHLYAVHRPTERLALGIGLNTPYGLSTEYDNDWAGRFHALRSEIITANVNPALALRLTPHLAIGVGASAQYFKATLTNAINFGIAEGRIKNKADDVSYGMNAGLMLSLSRATRIGITYRSGINHSLKGNASFRVPDAVADVPFSALNPNVPAALAGLPTSRFFRDGNITAQLDLPAMAAISVVHRTGDIEWLADATWTEWSSIPGLNIVFDDPLTTLGPAVQEFDWKNTWRLALGMNYEATDRLTLRAGAAYDESPIPDNTRRTPRLPGSDRYWVSVGASYSLSDNMSFDVAYLNLFAKGASLRNDNGAGALLTSTARSHSDEIGAQLTWRF